VATFGGEMACGKEPRERTEGGRQGVRVGGGEDGREGEEGRGRRRVGGREEGAKERMNGGREACNYDCSMLSIKTN
jgi:hypothetical protein